MKTIKQSPHAGGVIGILKAGDWFTDEKHPLGSLANGAGIYRDNFFVVATWFPITDGVRVDYEGRETIAMTRLMSHAEMIYKAVKAATV